MRGLEPVITQPSRLMVSDLNQLFTDSLLQIDSTDLGERVTYCSTLGDKKSCGSALVASVF